MCILQTIQKCPVDKIVGGEVVAAVAGLVVVEMAAEVEAVVYSHPVNYQCVQQVAKITEVAVEAPEVTPEEAVISEEEVILEGEEVTPEEEEVVEERKSLHR